MRSLGLAVLVLGCSQPAGTSILVTVTGNVPAFDHLAITLSAGGTMKTPSPIAQGTLPPDIVFGIEVPRSVAGPMHVAVAAVDGGGATLFSAADDVPLQPGQLHKLTLTLGLVQMDGGPTDDLSTNGQDLSIPENADLSTAPPDLRPAVPAVVNLAGARPLPPLTTTTRKFVDLDKDGKLDILDTGSTTFITTRNRGDGVFLAPSPFPRPGLQPAIDLNNDGLPDFVGYNSTTVDVSLNDGMGRYPMTGTPYVTDGTIYSLHVLDVNKDNRPDVLCYINNGGPQIQLFLNDGMGIFTKQTGLDTQISDLIATPDLTGDGTPEIFESWSTSTDWHSFINNGMGTFSPSPSPAGTLFNNKSAADITFKDINGDKKDDAVIKSTTQILAALSNGDGSFAGPTTSTLATTISTLSFSDSNGDMKPDIVAFLSSASIQVVLNNGSGAFGAPVSLTTGATVSSFVISEVNNDNRPDLVVLETGGTLDIFLNTGNGLFAGRVPYVVNAGSFPTLLDVNNDGFLDILTTGVTSFGVLLNNKAGAFGARADTTTPSGAAYADLTGDGIPDAYGAGGTGTQVWYSRNNSTGTFGMVVSVPMVNLFSPPATLVAADLTGDGLADIIGANSYVATTSGAPDLPTVVASSTVPVSLVIGDFLPDQLPDFVVTFGNTSVGRFLNLGGSKFSAEAPFTVGTNGTRLAAGHIKTPTSLDVVVTNSSTMDVSVLIGKGDGSFEPKVDYPLGATANTVALADFNHDMYDDLAVGLNTGNVGVLINNGSGIFKPKNDFAGTASLDLLVANLNTDLTPEIVTVATTPVSVLLNDGTGGFPSKNDYTWPGLTVSQARLIDLSGDGQLDLVAAVAPPTNGKLTLRTNNGNGTFGNPGDLVTDGNRFAFGDLNRDGRIDMVVAYPSVVRVLIQDQAGVFQPANEYYMPMPTFMEVADFDGDGLPEVICGGGTIGAQVVILRNVSR